MKPLPLNLSKMKKVASDQSSTTFLHPQGHQIKVAHAPLSALQKKQIEKMPLHNFDQGGGVQSAPPSDDAQLQAAIDNAKSSQPGPAASPTGDNVGDGYYRAPASIGGDLGSAIRGGISDAKDAFKTVFSPVLSQGKDFVQGLAGSDQPQPGSPKNDLPAAEKDLPGMGQPIGTSSSAPVQRTMASSSPAGSVPGVSIGDIYKTGLQGITAQQQAESEAGRARVSADKMYQDQMAAEDTRWQSERQAKMQEIQGAISDIQNGHINPNHYVENMSAPRRIASAIGMILGGAGAGGGAPNPGMEFLNNQINRDIDAQKANLHNKETLLGAYQSKYHDAVAAENMTKATQYGLYAAQLQSAADQSADPMAKARALQAKSALESQILPLVNNANAIEMLNSRQQAKAQNPQAFSQTAVDYPALNMLQKYGVMPQQDVEAATKESQAYENHVKQVGAVTRSWEQAQKDNTIANRAAHAGYEPASVSVLKTSLLPYLKDAEGRINEQELARTDGLIPRPGDGSAKISEKRAGMMQFLQEKNDPGSFPTLTRYGLINPTPHAQEAPAAQHRVGDVVYVRGQKMQIVDRNGNLKPVQ